MKKIFFSIGFVVILTMLFFTLSATASAKTYNNLTYEKNDGVIAITDCNESVISVDIPSEIDGCPVTTVGGYAFKGCVNLESITIPDTLNEIGYGAFLGCKKLESINIPDSVTKISTLAFNSCESLANINIPDNVTSIGELAFSNTAFFNNSDNWENDVLYINNHLIEAKDDITGIYEIKAGTITIGGQAFSDSCNLEGVIIPDSVLTIGNTAFCFCESLKSITIPDSVIEIEAAAFDCCLNLENIKIGKNVKKIGSDAFSSCWKLESIELPDGIEMIDGAFSGSGVKSISLPDSITRLGDYAFASCESLESVIINNSQCSIAYSVDTIPESAVIYGHINSTAQMYAMAYGRKFVPIEESYRFVYKVAEFFNMIILMFKNVFDKIFGLI